jgi:hypothetical protein
LKLPDSVAWVERWFSLPGFRPFRAANGRVLVGRQGRGKTRANMPVMGRGDSMGGRMLGRSDVGDGFAVEEVCVRFLGLRGSRYQTDGEFPLGNARKLRRQMLEPL